MTIMRRQRRQKLGPLEATVVEGSTAKTVVVCHGYGADSSDLAPLCSQIDKDGLYRWVFPDGPLVFPIGPGINGRSWFPIDMVELDRVLRRQDPKVWMEMRSLAMDEASSQLAACLAALDTPAEDTVLAGFSQGAMVSLDMVLKHQWRCAGMIILSGTLVSRPDWQRWAATMPGMRYLQSHGRGDQVLPFTLAEKLGRLLQDAGWEGEEQFFAGGHEIPFALLGKLKRFLEQCFA